MIVVLVNVWKDRSNAAIAFYITAKTQSGQLQNLSNVAFLSQNGHILDPWWRAIQYGTNSILMLS